LAPLLTQSFTGTLSLYRSRAALAVQSGWRFPQRIRERINGCSPRAIRWFGADSLTPRLFRSDDDSVADGVPSTDFLTDTLRGIRADALRARGVIRSNPMSVSKSVEGFPSVATRCGNSLLLREVLLHSNDEAADGQRLRACM